MKPKNFDNNIFDERSDLELNLMLDAVKKQYGYELRNYAPQVVRRVLFDTMNQFGYDSLSEMLHPVLHDRDFFFHIVTSMSTTVTEMFRDPSFYKAVRTTVIPHLHSYPIIKVWHAGCATGEEVYSMAILFQEEGLLSRTRFYGTDFNLKALEAAKTGHYTLSRLQSYTLNYNKSGGKSSFSDYYKADTNGGKILESLHERIVFVHHDLILDGSLGEMELIVCRNVLIYFERDIRDQILKMFSKSLINNGILCLGRDESLSLSSVDKQFHPLSKSEKIYIKGVPNGRKS